MTDYNLDSDPELDAIKNDLNSRLSIAKQDLQILLQEVSEIGVDGTFNTLKGFSFTSTLGETIEIDDAEIAELKEMRITFQGDVVGVLRDYFGTKLIKSTFREYKLDMKSANTFADHITNYLHGDKEFIVSSVDADSTNPEISIVFSTK